MMFSTSYFKLPEKINFFPGLELHEKILKNIYGFWKAQKSTLFLLNFELVWYPYHLPELKNVKLEVTKSEI